MSTNYTTTLFAAKALPAGLAALLLTLSPVVAQNPGTSAIEETAPALPADAVALAAAVIVEAAPPKQSEPATDTKSANPAVEDYTEKIGNGLKERERRLTLLNEAMMKLREAGEREDAARVEERICALLEMPEPSQAGARLRAEVEQMRAKNDELIVQLVSMEEELKRYRGTGSASVATSRKSSSR